jgi:uncharacterized protein YggU (UPF0235/DUF167 family)
MATIAIRVKPGSSRTRVGGCHDGPYGPALVVAVTAAAVDGQATEAALRALAEALALRRSALWLRAGATGRNKLVDVPEAPADLDDRVRALRESGSGQ